MFMYNDWCPPTMNILSIAHGLVRASTRTLAPGLIYTTKLLNDLHTKN